MNNTILKYIKRFKKKNFSETLSKTEWKLLASSTIHRLFSAAAENSMTYQVYEQNMNGTWAGNFPNYVWESLRVPKTAFLSDEDIIRSRLSIADQCKVRVKKCKKYHDFRNIFNYS